MPALASSTSARLQPVRRYAPAAVRHDRRPQRHSRRPRPQRPSKQRRPHSDHRAPADQPGRGRHSAVAACTDQSTPPVPVHGRSALRPRARKVLACDIGAYELVIPGAFQVHYVANLDVDDSFINITNDGQSTPVLDPVAAPNGNLCVGVYAFDPNEELQSCCTCLVTPGGLASLSARAINAASLTGENPTSLVIKLLSWSTSVRRFVHRHTRNAGTAEFERLQRWYTPGQLRAVCMPGVRTYIALPVSGYTVTETPFSLATLSPAELANITQSCEFNQINGSGITGQCPGCTVGGQ